MSETVGQTDRQTDTTFLLLRIKQPFKISSENKEMSRWGDDLDRPTTLQPSHIAPLGTVESGVRGLQQQQEPVSENKEISSLNSRHNQREKALIQPSAHSQDEGRV